MDSHKHRHTHTHTHTLEPANKHTQTHTHDKLITLILLTTVTDANNCYRLGGNHWL